MGAVLSGWGLVALVWWGTVQGNLLLCMGRRPQFGAVWDMVWWDKGVTVCLCSNVVCQGCCVLQKCE